MKNYSSTFVDRFASFVCDDEGVSIEQIRADLQKDGVDIDSFLGRVRALVAEKIQGAIRTKAQKEIAEAQERDSDVTKQVDLYSREELLRIFTSAQSGQLGHTGQEIALAARNATGDEPDVEELKALVHDILSAHDKDSQP